MKPLQWLDAEVIADVEHLLVDLNPRRRTLNLNRAEGAEEALWTDLNRRRDDAQRRLLLLGTGHASKKVRMFAQLLAVQVLNAAAACQWTVSDMLRHEDYREQVKSAMQDHATAEATTEALKQAVQEAGSGRRR